MLVPKVPPVTQIQELEGPKISVETESVPDDDDLDAPFAPPLVMGRGQPGVWWVFGRF